MKKGFVLLVLIFSVCYLFADDNWRTVENASDIIGRWEGSMIVPLPSGSIDEMLPDSSMDVIFAADFSRTANANRLLFAFEIVVDLDKFLDDLLRIPEVKILGISRDTFWELFAAELSSFSIPDLDIVVKKYSIGFMMSEEVEDSSMDFSQGYMLINNERTMIKLIFEEELSFGLGDEGFRELVMHKR